MSYAAHGAVSALTLGNGVEESVQFTPRLQPSLIEAKSGTTTLLRLDYCWSAPLTSGSCPAAGADNNGNVRQIKGTMADGTQFRQQYSYDAFNRLLEAKEDSTWRETSGYDRYGNRYVDMGTDSAGEVKTSGFVPEPGTPLSAAAFNSANNRLTGQNYDLAGNLTSASPYTLKYDAENRLISATSPSNGSAAYAYDGEGRRVQRITCPGAAACTGTESGAVTTTYVYDAGGRLAAEYRSQPDPEQPSGTVYLTTDHLGSTRLMTEAAHPALNPRRFDYRPFGGDLLTSNRTAASGYGKGGTTLKFTGKERDDSMTRLDYFGARYYSGAQGRFTSPDRPFADQDEANPQSWNLYAYARNNPLKYTDPDGERVRICITGGQCFDVNDSDYPGLQPGNLGVVLPTFNFGTDEVSIQSISCGGQNCGTATYINDSPGLTPVLHPLQDVRDQIAPLNPRTWLSTGVRGGVAMVIGQPGKGKPRIHPGKQGKHLPGHNNFQTGKSELTHPNPQALLDKGAGTGRRVSDSKEVVDFGETIGVWVGPQGQRAPTTRGTIHYDASGSAHIVPARP